MLYWAWDSLTSRPLATGLFLVAACSPAPVPDPHRLESLCFSPGTPNDLTIDSSRIYWTSSEPNALNTAPLAGCETLRPASLATDRCGALLGLADDGQRLVFGAANCPLEHDA